MLRDAFSLAVVSLLALGCATDESTSPQQTGSGGMATDSASSDDQDGDEPGGGSTSDGGGGDEPNPSGNYHPAGFAEAQIHGLAAKLQEEDCRTCHGMDLAGVPSNGPSCDSCHPQQWRTDCTFCHGGDLSDNGAPPRDIDDDADPSSLSFQAHSAHALTTATHAAFDCTQCHTKPSSATDLGHLFDETPGRAEVDFAAGLSAGAQYQDGACANLYCHGNGLAANGLAQDGMPSPGCGGCHGYDQPGGWTSMSGQHQRHLADGLECVSCHGGVVAPGGTIVNLASHVDGEVTVAVTESGVTFNGQGCTGLCHLKVHFSEAWQ